MPDVARVRVDVDGDGASQESAYAAAARPAAAVDAVPESCSHLLGSVIGAGLLLEPKTRWRHGESVRTGRRAARSTTVEVTVLEELGGLLSRLAGADASVAGPWWGIAPDNAAYAQVRTAAVRDARERAQACASGLGLAVGAVAWVAEPGLRPGAVHDDAWSPGESASWRCRPALRTRTSRRSRSVPWSSRSPPRSRSDSRSARPGADHAHAVATAGLGIDSVGSAALFAVQPAPQAQATARASSAVMYLSLPLM